MGWAMELPIKPYHYQLILLESNTTSLMVYSIGIEPKDPPLYTKKHVVA